MNTLFGFLSSPLKKQPERPSPSTMPVSASQSRILSPRERRLSKRASDRFSESEGRSPRSRRSNVSSTSSVHDTTADISITSSRRETIATMPPPSKTPKRTSMSGPQSSPAMSRLTASQRVASSPRVRSSPRRLSVELGEDSIVSGLNSVNNSPAFSNRAPSVKNSPALSTATRRSSVRNSPATSTAKNGATMKPNFTAVNSPLVADDDRSPARPSPKAQPRARRSLVVAEEQDEEEAPAVEEPEVEEPEVEEQEVEAQAPEEADQEDPEQEAPAQEAENDDEEHEFKRIMDHRWVGDKIELRIEWSDGERTWTDEEIFHEDSPEALFEFWRNQPGGRPPNPNDPGLYQVFAIRKHRTLRGKKQVLVEWLGYDSSEHTWENQSYIEQVAKDHVDEYMSKLKGKGKANTKTKPTTKNTTKTTKKGTAKTVAKGRGRPKAETKSSTRTIAAPVSKTLGRSRVTKR